MSRDIVEELKNAPHSDFPNSLNYAEMFMQIDNYMNTDIHPHTVIGATMKDGGLLNDHGVEHVKMVIKRAGEILKLSSDIGNNLDLSSYEKFLLLVAIHLHDVGNIYGREEHESKTGDIAQKLLPYTKNNIFEMEAIKRIARAHGGRHEGSKDTITHLDDQDPLNGQMVRKHLLAAILKFADELADDRMSLPLKTVPLIY